MTDTEIIKALECCGEHKRFCDGCTYNNKTVDYCDSDLCKDAVALINRQKAEIERLQGIILAFEKVEHNSLCETETYKVGE